MNKKLYALGRLKGGELNKTELAYQKRLEQYKAVGHVLWFKFEAINLRLADNTFYKPDFLVMLHDGTLECHEVKGFWLEDAKAKIKIAAAMYPFKFLAVRVKPKKDGGGWEIQEF